MIRHRPLPGERIEMYSAVGLLPLDIFTQKAPIGGIEAVLDLMDINGTWVKTDIKAIRTASGVIAYPGLGRSGLTGVSRRYRVRFRAEQHRPHYLLADAGEPGGIITRTTDGIEFDVHPYNDLVPPQNAVELSFLWEVWFAPTPNYPFPDHFYLLRGEVRDGTTGRGAAGVEVSWKPNQQVMTVENGTFCLPLMVTRKTELSAPQIIAADDLQGKSGNITITIPDVIGKSQTIIIN